MALRGSRGLGLGLLQLQKFSSEVPLRWVRTRRALSSNSSMLADLSSPPEQPQLQKKAFCHDDVVSGYFPGSIVPLEVRSCKWVKSREIWGMGEGGRSCSPTLVIPWGLQDPSCGQCLGDALPAEHREMTRSKASS